MLGRATALTLAYLAIAVVWQVVLWRALPNVGMGGLAIAYVFWPLLVLSALCLWFALKKAGRNTAVLFFSVTFAMLLGMLALHPQDSQISFAQKLDVVFGLNLAR